MSALSFKMWNSWLKASRVHRMSTAPPSNSFLEQFLLKPRGKHREMSSYRPPPNISSFKFTTHPSQPRLSTSPRENGYELAPCMGQHLLKNHVKEPRPLAPSVAGENRRYSLAISPKTNSENLTNPHNSATRPKTDNVITAQDGILPLCARMTAVAPGTLALAITGYQFSDFESTTAEDLRSGC
jgi:hypothetical protein